MSSPVATRAAAPGAAPNPDTSVESVDRILQRARDHLGLDVAFVAEVTVDGNRIFRHVVASGDGPAPVVGGYDPLDQTYCGMILDGSLPAVTPDTREVPALQALPVTAAFGIGCYLGVPIELPDGDVYGTLCAYGRSPDSSLNARDADTLRFLATLIAERIESDTLSRLEWQVGFDAVTELLGGDRLHIVWQPIIDLATGRAVGYEALSRFAVEPALAPDVAFAMAARVGLGVELELRAAAEALGRLAELPPDVYVSINLSAAALASPACGQLLAGAPLARVVVELTEHESEVGDEALAVLAALRSRGLRLAMDDLGSGYSGLARVLRLAPDIIKLDRSLITTADVDPARQALVVATAGFARSMGAHLVAEGIETTGECTTMRELGATHGQGYYLGRPHPQPWSVAEQGTAILAAMPTVVRRRAGSGRVPGRLPGRLPGRVLDRALAGLVAMATFVLAATLCTAALTGGSPPPWLSVTDAGGMSAACAVLALVGMLALRARRQRTERGPLREAGRRLAQIDAELALRRT